MTSVDRLGKNQTRFRPPYRYRFHVTILFANNQIYDEASNVFYRENLFVRLCLIYDPGPSIPNVCFLASGNTAENFKYYSLEIGFHPSMENFTSLCRSRGAKNFMLTSDELPMLCKAPVGLRDDHDDRHRVLEAADIQLRVLPCLMKAYNGQVPRSTSADLPSTKLLLEPFRALRGTHSLDVVGFVSIQYCSAIKCNAYRKGPAVEDVLLKVEDLKNEGDQAQEDGNTTLAISHYQEAIDHLDIGFDLATVDDSSTGIWADGLVHKATKYLYFEVRSALAAVYFSIAEYEMACEQGQRACLLHLRKIPDPRRPRTSQVWFCRAMASKALGNIEIALGEANMAVCLGGGSALMREELDDLMEEAQILTGKHTEQTLKEVAKLLDPWDIE